MDYGYNYGVMHLLWWFIWMVFLFWIFAIPYDLPGQRKRKDTPLDVIKKLYAAGQITKEEYQERKELLEKKS